MSDLFKDFCKTDKYLIYSCFSSKMSADLGGSTVSGSLIMSSANTPEEAQEKINILKVRKQDFHTKYPGLKKEGDTSDFIFIKNKSEWWSRS